MLVEVIMTKQNMQRQQRLKRTLPYLKSLKRVVGDTQKRNLLKTFPAFVVDDIVEILYNILHRNVPVKSHRHLSVLRKKKKTLAGIVAKHKHPRLRKQLVYQQKGGFISAILPILTSVLGGVLSSAL